MTTTVAMAGDIASAGAALAGLILVFMGSVATSYESLHKTTQTVVRSKYQFRVRFAFFGFLTAVISTLAALAGEFLNSERSVLFACVALVVSVGLTIATAARAAMDVK